MTDTADIPPKEDTKTEMSNSNDHIWKSPIWTKRIESLLNNEYMSDITFVVNGERFYAHQFVLALDSEVFYAMFYGPMADDRKEIDIVDCENPEDFLEFLSLIYKKSANVTWENVEQLSYLRKKYMIMEMGLFSKLVKSTVETGNCLDLLDISVALEEDSMIEECLKVIRRDVSALIKTQQFLELKQPALKVILIQSMLNINEIDLFIAVDEWCSNQVKLKKLNGKMLKKKKALGDALYLIRFPLIGLEDFAVHCRPSNLLTHKEIIEVYDAIALNLHSTVPRSAQNSQVDEDKRESCCDVGVVLAPTFICKARLKGYLNVCVEEEGMVNNEAALSTNSQMYPMYDYNYYYGSSYSHTQYLVFTICSNRNVWLKGLKISPLSVTAIIFDGKESALEYIDKEKGIARFNTPYVMEAGERYAFRTMRDNLQIFVSRTAGENEERCHVIHKWNDFEFSLGMPTTRSPLRCNQLIFSIFDATPIDDDYESKARCLDITAIPEPSNDIEAV